jgi:hypothetical protein
LLPQPQSQLGNILCQPHFITGYYGGHE